MKGPKHKSSVLIVDDNRMIFNLIDCILGISDYTLYFAQSATDAIKILNTCSIDLILLDIVMPEIDGYQLCKKIKDTQAWNQIPVIFISSLNDPNDIVKGLQQGGVDFISKPFNREELVARVSNQLEIKKIQDQYKYQLEELRKTNRYLLGTMHDMARVMEDSRILN